MRKQLILISSIIALVLLCGCHQSTKVHDKGKIQVYTSMYPLADFAKKIGGTHVEVTNLVPPGTEPHDFELSPQDMVKLSEADVLIYNGADFEGWIEKTIQNINTKKTTIVNTSKGLNLTRRNGRTDPHIWLDPQLAKAQSKSIKDALVKVDRTYEKEYEKHFIELTEKFDQLDREYRAMVMQASRKEFVVSHAAFHYLADRYGLTQIPITGVSPLEEPSPKELRQLIHTMKKHQVRHIFFETLVNNKLAIVIKEEIKAKVLTLNPLEGLTKEELSQGEDYFSVMKKNKENLSTALGEK